MGNGKIGMLTGGSIVALAGGVDGGVALINTIYVVPVVGWILGVVIGYFFMMVGGTFLFSWFAYLGVPFAGRMGMAAIIEAIPVLNTFPGWTMGAVWTIMKANEIGAGEILGMIGLTTGTGVMAKAALSEKAAGQMALRGAATAAPQSQESEPQSEGPATRVASPVKDSRAYATQTTREAPNDGLLVRAPREQSA